MHCEVLPHPTSSPDLVSSDFHLFGPFKEVLEGKRVRANNDKLFMQQATTNSF